MLKKFRFADLLMIIIPGALCAAGAAATLQSDQSDVRTQGTIMFAVAFVLYTGSYALTRITVPYSVQHFTTIVLLIPAFVSLFVAGMSMGAGYGIAAYISAPIWGALFGIGGMLPDGLRGSLTEE